MPERAIPPLQREALERLPVALERLRTYWQTTRQSCAVVDTTLEDFNPEQMDLLYHTFTNAMAVYSGLRRIQEHPDWLVETIVEDFEDERAVTD